MKKIKFQTQIGIVMTAFSLLELADAVRVAVISGAVQNVVLSLMISIFMLILSLMCAFGMDTKRIFQAHCITEFLLAIYFGWQMFTTRNESFSLNGKPDTALPGLNAVGSVLLMMISVMFLLMCMVLIFMGILGLFTVRKQKRFTACIFFCLILLLMQAYLKFPAVSMIYTLFYLVLIFTLTDSGIFVPKKEENAP